MSSAPKLSRPLVIESLEQRRVLTNSIQVSLVGSELIVKGTDLSDEVSIIQRDDQNELVVRTRVVSTTQSSQPSEWTSSTWQSSKVTKINARLGNSNDLFRFETFNKSPRFAKQVSFNLGEGNDQAQLQYGTSTAPILAKTSFDGDGGNGNDSIVVQLGDIAKSTLVNVDVQLRDGDDVGSVIAGSIANRLVMSISGGNGQDKLSYRSTGNLAANAALNLTLDGNNQNDQVDVDLQGALLGSVQLRAQGSAGDDTLGLSLIHEGAGRIGNYVLSGDQGNDRFNVDFGASDSVIGIATNQQVVVQGGPGRDSYVGPQDVKLKDIESSRTNLAWQTLIDGVVKPYLSTQPELNVYVGLRTPSGSREMYSYGTLARSNSPKTNPSTLFEIGSITKTFTTTVLAELVRRGDVRLNDPVRIYLPEGAVVPTRGSREITLEELATHRSGLPRETVSLEHLLDQVLKEYQEGNVNEDHLNELLNAEARRDWPQLQSDLFEIHLDDIATPEPGYSNLGVGLLGFALANHLGMSYEAMIRTYVLEPLGLKQVYQTIPAADLPQFSQGYFASDVPMPPLEFNTLAGAGALRASGVDLLRYMEAQLDPSYSSLADTIATTHVPRGPAPDSNGNPAVRVGLGWIVGDLTDSQIVMHNGATFGFQSDLFANTSSGAGYVLLANSRDDRTDEMLQSLNQLLSNALLGQGLDSPVEPLPEPRIVLNTLTQTLEIQGRIAGEQLRIERDEGKGVTTVSFFQPSTNTWTDRLFSVSQTDHIRLSLGDATDKVEFVTRGDVTSNVWLDVMTGNGADVVRLDLGNDSGGLRSTINAKINLGTGDDVLDVKARHQLVGSKLIINARLGDGNDVSQLEIHNPSVVRASVHASIFGEDGNDELYTLALDDLARGASATYRMDGGSGNDMLAQAVRGQILGNLLVQLSGGTGNDSLVSDASEIFGRGNAQWTEDGGAGDDLLVMVPPSLNGNSSNSVMRGFTSYLDGGAGYDRTTLKARARTSRIELYGVEAPAGTLAMLKSPLQFLPHPPAEMKGRQSE